jgi:hypothetical protein
MPRVDTRWPTFRRARFEQARDQLGRLFEQQRDDVKARQGSGLTLLSSQWDDRLADVLLDINRTSAREAGRRIAEAFGFREFGFDPDLMDPWLEEGAWAAAVGINDLTRSQLEDDDPDDVYDLLFAARLGVMSEPTSAINFGVHDAATGVGAGGKQWQVNSGNPRDTHAAISGEIAAMGGTFSNGMRWPGDPVGGADEVANCQCSLTIL